MKIIKKVALVFVSAALGGASVWVLQGHSLRIIPSAMSYSDFVAIILTALSVLIAVILAAIAVFTIWGVTEFRKGVEAKIKALLPESLSREFQVGGARQVLVDLVAEFYKAEASSPGTGEAWADEMARQQAKLRELDADPPED